jgi:hypothetical protein
MSNYLLLMLLTLTVFMLVYNRWLEYLAQRAMTVAKEED